jgi:NAD(P)-dependent dehydrogenase (short-subunit alcohol dehydrogenase family)
LIDTKQVSSTVLNIVTTMPGQGQHVVPSATAKAGVLAMTRSLAVEWAKYRIRTNAIAPGPSLLKVLGTDYFLVI